MRLRPKASIGARIFTAFVAMSLITAALGFYGLFVLSIANRFVADTYDRSMMAISYAQSAGLNFARIDKEIFRRTTTAADQREPIDGLLDRLGQDFSGDLAIARERSDSPEVHTVIDQIAQLATQWSARRSLLGDAGAHDLDALGEKIIERLDRLIELTAGDSFVARRKAVDAMHQFNIAGIVAIGLALLLSAAITFLLARRIVRPLAAAAVVADHIADGEFETAIPSGGSDETGTLLRSMQVMQANIRSLIAREQAQRRSAQNRFSEALENSNEAMALLDASGRLVIANRQLARFVPSLKQRLDEGGDFAEAFDQIAQLSDEEGRQLMQPDETAAGPLATGHEFRLADGRWLRVSRSQTQEGGLFLVLSDLTDVKEREERLEEAKQRAEAAAAAKTTFLANMSHELRTPLNAIIGFSEIIVGEMFGKLGNAKYIEYAGNIKLGGDHLLNIINSVLDLTKSQAGKLQLELETFDVCQMVESCAAMISERCRHGDLRLDVALPETPILLYGDCAKVRQILLNLLSNAVKFTDPGGKVAVAAQIGDGQVRLKVTDTGIGMASEHIPIAFAAFGQIDSRLARRYDGAGLGLPLTKALVDLHGGTIEIDSELGKGTSVAVVLPALECAPADTGCEIARLDRVA